MENAPFARAGSVSAAGSLDRVPRKARNMSKSSSSSGEILKDQLSAAVTETAHDKPPLPSVFTLRVKPDRRCVQLPIPGGRDRRQPR